MANTSLDVVQLFAKRFRAARKAANMRQADVHDKTGIAVSYLSSVERGQRSVTIERAARMADAVGCKLYQLLTP